MLNVLSSVIVKCKHNFDYVDLGGGMGINYNNKDKKLNYKKYNFFRKIFKNTVQN